MQKACWATYYHKCSTDAKPQHGLCPIVGDSWCRYNRDAAHGLLCSEHTNSLPLAVMETIKPIYTILCDRSLLSRCLHQKTQNCNEAFNNLIWSRLPKNTFVNAETIRLGVLDAVLSYNEGSLAKVRVLEDLCGTSGSNCVVGLRKQDFIRVRKAERAIQEIEKKARKARQAVKRRLIREKKEKMKQVMVLDFF